MVQSNTESKCIIKIKPLYRYNCNKICHALQIFIADMILGVPSWGSEPRDFLKKKIEEKKQNVVFTCLPETSVGYKICVLSDEARMIFLFFNTFHITTAALIQYLPISSAYVCHSKPHS